MSFQTASKIIIKENRKAGRRAFRVRLFSHETNLIQMIVTLFWEERTRLEIE
ncbi:MAG: hypothetical protein H0U96_04310 [Acidobacteria bacterium]|nr:hypothetical protein [Acidobacteriota bacterium]